MSIWSWLFGKKKPVEPAVIPLEFHYITELNAPLPAYNFEEKKEEPMKPEVKEMKSVSARIGDAVHTFVQRKVDAARWGTQMEAEFTAADLRSYVVLRVGYVAPGSSDRILRNLRQKGVLNYVLVNRAKSLYRALPLRQEAKGAAA